MSNIQPETYCTYGRSMSWSGRVGDVRRLRRRDRNQLGLAPHRCAHQPERRIRASRRSSRLAVAADPVPRERIEPLRHRRPAIGRSSTASISRNADVQAPMASASDRTAAHDVVLVLHEPPPAEDDVGADRFQPGQGCHVHGAWTDSGAGALPGFAISDRHRGCVRSHAAIRVHGAFGALAAFGGHDDTTTRRHDDDALTRATGQDLLRGRSGCP